MKENEIGDVVVERSLYLHRNLGPGLLESVMVYWNRNPRAPVSQ